MKAILTIGHRHFLIADVAKASMVLKILGSAVLMDSKFVKLSHSISHVYFPMQQELELGLKMINEDQLRAVEPETNSQHEETSSTMPLVEIKVLPRRRRLLLGSGQ